MSPAYTVVEAILAIPLAAGAKGMPLVVEVSVGFSVLVALSVIGVFLFGIRDRFSSFDAAALDRFQGDRR